MNQELLHLLEQISREKGIEKSVLAEAVLSAVLSAARKRFGTIENIDARLDETTGAITLFSPKTVMHDDDIVDDSVEISLEEAQPILPTATVGDTVEVIHEMDDFGRIAAQTAKQVIIQKVREAERDTIYREFRDRQGELVNGVVTRVEREGNLSVDLGKTEALLPRREQSFRETFKRNDRIRAYITEVKRSSSGPQVILSRIHPGFLTRLFEMEVPEVYEGIVEIKEAARDTSGRAKIAVASNDKDVDPVGACVGMKGMRVQSVVQELRGEKIDIIPWVDDQTQFVRNALSPAKVAHVYVHEAEKTMQVIVPSDQRSLAIGKRGQNVRLAAKLTHWRIDIVSEEEADVDTVRQEALRQAELAFQIPQRTSDAAQRGVEETSLTSEGSDGVEEAAPLPSAEADMAAASAPAILEASAGELASDESPDSVATASQPSDGCLDALENTSGIEDAASAFDEQQPREQREG
ncbi:MAG: transcription termination factor NusA [Gammaproteobacteria bacterium]